MHCRFILSPGQFGFNLCIYLLIDFKYEVIWLVGAYFAVAVYFRLIILYVRFMCYRCIFNLMLSVLMTHLLPFKCYFLRNIFLVQGYQWFGYLVLFICYLSFISQHNNFYDVGASLLKPDDFFFKCLIVFNSKKM